MSKPAIALASSGIDVCAFSTTSASCGGAGRRAVRGRRRRRSRGTCTRRVGGCSGSPAAAAAATGFYYLRMSWGKPVAASDRVVRAELRTIANSVNATGTVRLRVGSEVRVGSQLSGIVRKLNVTVGSHVRAEEVIAEIDPENRGSQRVAEKLGLRRERIVLHEGKPTLRYRVQSSEVDASGASTSDVNRPLKICLETD